MGDRRTSSEDADTRSVHPARRDTPSTIGPYRLVPVIVEAVSEPR